MPFQALARPSLEPRTGPYLVWTTQSSIAMRLELLFHASPQVNETVGAAVPNIDRPLICVGDPRKGWIHWLFRTLLISLPRSVLRGGGPQVGVEVERPQRSEDERPRGRRGCAAYWVGAE